MDLMLQLMEELLRCCHCQVGKMKFDFFVEKLKCNDCGKFSMKDSSTNMQTKIQGLFASGLQLEVGTKLTSDKVKLEDFGYLKLSEHDEENSLVVIDQWDCPFCGSALNWAKISISKMVIVKIQSIRLCQSEISQANYLFEDFKL